jgi:hypothetical protein
MATSEFTIKPWREWLQKYGLVLAIYLLASWSTNANYPVDAFGYAGNILAKRFDDFGHFLWLPLGWLGFQVLGPLAHWVLGPGNHAGVVWTLIVLNWFAGLLSVFMMLGIISRICSRAWVANLTTTTFVFTQMFLVYSQTGASYIPGLSLLLLGFWILIGRGKDPAPDFKAGLLAGLALAGSVSLWVPYVLGIPAALASPLLIYGFAHNRLRFVCQTAAVFALATGMVFTIGAASLGIYTVAGFRSWITESSHGVIGNNGLPRMLFGFARSFINMGNDGVLFKRFLVQDPFNPVSFFDLLRISLWKMTFFYLYLASVFVILLRGCQGRRIFWLWLINAIPVLGFAVLWQGGDWERYAALYPSIFIAFAYSLSCDWLRSWFRSLAMAFLAVVAISTLSATNRPVVARQQERIVDRINDLLPLLKPQSLVATVTQQDEVWAFIWAFPLHLLNREDRLHTYRIVELNTIQVRTWRQDFAARTMEVWKEGGDMWVTRRVLNPQPLPHWNWVEGNDRNVSWAEIRAFFSRFELGQTAGNYDGFMMLPHTPRNEAALEGVDE